jgi:hypothetical protein
MALHVSINEVSEHAPHCARALAPTTIDKITLWTAVVAVIVWL